MKGHQTPKARRTGQDGDMACFLRAGVAKGDITTRTKGAQIHDPLYAKALVLDDGTTRLAIIAMDVVALGMIGDIKDDFLSKLRGRIQKELKIPGRNVLVNASHTHPPGRLLCSDIEQLDRTFDAVRRAAGNMLPVKLILAKEDRLKVNESMKIRWLYWIKCTPVLCTVNCIK